MKKVSCVMTTYRRFTCVERSIALFLAQDYTDTELIIYNTDVKYPLSLDDTFDGIDNKIKVINNNIDFETKQPYTNVGAIRRDARMFASGDGYITWDDDDIFFPWNIRQCVDGLLRTNKSAWKPHQSFMKHRGHPPHLFSNNLEASILVKMSVLDKYGFNLNKSGAEHLSWLEELSRLNDISVDQNSIPGYCFYWADEPDVAGHKQSNLDEFVREDNFQRHKLYTTDYAKRPFTKKSLENYLGVFAPFITELTNFKSTQLDLYEKYVMPNIDQLTISKQLPIEYVKNRREYILFKNDCGVSDHARRGTIYEPHIFDYIKNNISKEKLVGSTIIDVGANLGFHSLEFADLVGKTGNVVCFEPQKLIYYQLCGNIIINGYSNITAHNMALGDMVQILKMENPQYTANRTINIGNAHLDAWTQAGYNIINVQPLDTFQFDNVSIIKIDVQGYEPKVLDGAKNTIQKHRPIIFIEIEQDQLSVYNYDETEIFNRMETFNYKIEKIGNVDYVATPN